jgi:hypothetical protein
MRDIACMQSCQRGCKQITPRGGGDAAAPLHKVARGQRRRSKSSAINNKVLARTHPPSRAAPSLAMLAVCLGVAVAVSVAVLAVGASAAASAITVNGRTAMTGGVNGPIGGAFVHVLAGAPVLLAADVSGGSACTLWKFDATSNALLSSVALTILAVSGRSCFAHGTTGYFGALAGTTNNWQVVALDTMVAGATSTIDSLWRGCSLEPTSGAFALCTRAVNPMVLAKLNRAPVTKDGDLTVTGFNLAAWFTAVDNTFFFAASVADTPFKLLRLDHTATFDAGALSTLTSPDAGDGSGFGVFLNSATAATVAYVTTSTRFVRIACATTPMTRLGGVDRPGTANLFSAVFCADTTNVYLSNDAAQSSVYRYDVATDAFITADTVTLLANEGYATLVLPPFAGKLLATTWGSARSMVYMTIPAVTTSTTSTTTTTPTTTTTTMTSSTTSSTSTTTATTTSTGSATPTTTTTGRGAAAAAAEGNALTTGQSIGIGVGVAAFACLAVVAVAFWFAARRQKDEDKKRAAEPTATAV